MKHQYGKIIGLSVLYLVAVYLSAFLGFLGPIGWVFFPALAALLGAYSYYNLARRWQTFGVETWLGIALSVFLLLKGEINWGAAIIITTIAIVSDLIRLSFGYKSRISLLCAYPVFSLSVICWLSPLWINADRYYSNAVDEMGLNYARALMPMSSIWVLLLLVAITLLLGYVGVFIATKNMPK